MNDGSRDGQKLAKLAKHHAEITVVELRRNFGQQIAVLCGLGLASGASCVVMDADLQDPPTALPLLWRARAPNVATVFAGRRGRYQPRASPDILDVQVAAQCPHGVAPKDASMYVLMERSLVQALVRNRADERADPPPG